MKDKKIKKGTRVEHWIFGKGTVLEAAPLFYVVKFDVLETPRYIARSYIKAA